MSGIRYLFISKDNHVYKITTPKYNFYKAVPELSGQDILEVILYYDTIERKPSRLLSVSFDRLLLDENGLYILTQEEIEKGMRNYLLFAFQSPETIAKNDIPLTIPTTVCIPTKPEKDRLKNYLKKYLPQLYCEGSQVIEAEIANRIGLNNKNKSFILEAAKIRKSNNDNKIFPK